MKRKNSSQKTTSKFANALIAWYRQNFIPYPWRMTTDIYPIWLSEVLLQQTRIPVALKFYEAILVKYPTLNDLANAKEEEFLAVWSGIGYYSRARNMLRCARKIVEQHSGSFPESWEDLLGLPGIGPYTAGALSGLCFGKLKPAVDGNTRRVLARVTNNTNLMDSSSFESEVERAFLELGKSAPPRDYVQALMELGERICLPTPDCSVCPVEEFCEARKSGTALQLPRRAEKRKPVPYYWYLLLLRKGKSFYLVQNGKREFLRDSWIFPDVLSEKKLTAREITHRYRQLGISITKPIEAGVVNHSVTFRRIRGVILIAEKYKLQNVSGRWLTAEEMRDHHTSSVTQKVLNRTSASLG